MSFAFSGFFLFFDFFKYTEEACVRGVVTGDTFTSQKVEVCGILKDESTAFCQKLFSESLFPFG